MHYAAWELAPANLIRSSKCLGSVSSFLATTDLLLSRFIGSH